MINMTELALADCASSWFWCTPSPLPFLMIPERTGSVWLILTPSSCLALALTVKGFWDSARPGSSKSHGCKRGVLVPIFLYQDKGGWGRVWTPYELPLALNCPWTFEPPMSKHGFCCCPAQHYPEGGRELVLRPAHSLIHTCSRNVPWIAKQTV
jgi:hypothetical protein